MRHHRIGRQFTGTLGQILGQELYLRTPTKIQRFNTSMTLVAGAKVFVNNTSYVRCQEEPPTFSIKRMQTRLAVNNPTNLAVHTVAP